MKTLLFSALVLIPAFSSAQSSTPQENFAAVVSNSSGSARTAVAGLIPKKTKGLYGFINQNSKTVIAPAYSNVGFFTEECTLLNSPNEQVRLYGSDNYASVIKNGKDYRIDKTGKTVYEFKKADLGKCSNAFVKQVYYGYSENGKFGISKTVQSTGAKYMQIAPQYQLVHVMEGNDVENPMILVVKDDKFGVVDKDNNIVVPVVYADIKRNFSWKLAGLFEVTKDGNNYFFVDTRNNRY